MKILADENIPGVGTAFAGFGEVQICNGRALTSAAVRDVDVLLVRSVTRVNPHLLEHSRVRFVASATAGVDHVDTAWLAQAGIHFAYAPGSNANSVAEYVLSAVLTLTQRCGFEPRGKVLGIIGCGHVGSRVRALLSALGMLCQVYDPPLQQAALDSDLEFVDFETVLQADLLSLHVPLLREARYPTWHMLDHAALQRMKPGAILINTARGEVIDGEALQAYLVRQPKFVVLDVWEHEPAISKALLDQVTLATPHIAGYSMDAKLNGVRMIQQAFCEHFGLPNSESKSPLQRQPLVLEKHTDTLAMLRQAVFIAYAVQQDDTRLRGVFECAASAQQAAAGFDRLRKEYPIRREFDFYTVQCHTDAEARLLGALGFDVQRA